MSRSDILIFNSSKNKNIFLENIFSELSVRGHSFCYYHSGDSPGIDVQGGYLKKIRLCPITRGAMSGVFFFICLPALRIYYFFRLMFVKLKRKPKTAILAGLGEKMVLPPILRFFRFKQVWIEEPGIDYGKIGFLSKRVYKKNAKKSLKIAFNSLTKERLLKLGIPEDNIKVISPGIKIKADGEQKALPLEAPEAASLKFKNKFFTVGTVADPSSAKSLETLFQAIKICSEFIPNIQLIVVGDGAERKNLGWTVKKMGIETLVWLVGNHGHTTKWMDSFDLFVFTGETARMPDMFTVLKCMSAGLPVIAPAGDGLDDIIEEGKTGAFFYSKDSQAVAAEIIKLFREQAARLKLGQAGKARARESFDLINKVKEFENII